MTKKESIARAKLLLNLLWQEYRVLPQFLVWKTPFELLISVILSAQTTDAQVNHVAPSLFRRFPDAQSLAQADQTEIEDFVRSTGFFRLKAQRIKEAAKRLVDDYGGMVPDNMDDLLTLAGVGRKTAGVILFQVFGKPAIIVDTHFGRVCRRLFLSNNEDPQKLELDIAKVFVPDDWGPFSMLANIHGRTYCKARGPRCSQCPLKISCTWQP